MLRSCALHQPLLKSTISHAKEPPCNNMYSTYKNWPPWENPNALYPSFNSVSLANCLHTSSTCLFAFRKKPFSISWNKKEKLLPFPQCTTTVLSFHHDNNDVLSICHMFNHIITGCFKIIPAIIFTRKTLTLHVLNWSLQPVYFYQHVQCHNLRNSNPAITLPHGQNFLLRNKEYFEVLVKEEL